MTALNSGPVRSAVRLAAGLAASALAVCTAAGCDAPEERLPVDGSAGEPAAPVFAGGDSVITLVADAWPPFNCSVEDSNEGYMVDVARAVFEPLGYEVDYLNVPWKRALSGTRSGLYDGAVAPSRLEGPGFRFPDLELSVNRVSFFVRCGSGWRFEGPASLADVRVGGVRGYDYVGWLNDYLAAHEDRPDRVQILAGDYPLRQNLRKLLAGRIDVLVGNASCIRYVAFQMGLRDSIRHAGADPESSLCYIAFSPAIEEGARLADLLSRGISDLRRTGRLDALLARYGLTDWADADPGPGGGS